MGNPHHHWTKNLLVDNRLGSYNIQLTPKWARRIDDAASPSPPLSDIVCDFVLAMRSVGIVASLPYTIVSQMENFVVGYCKGVEPPPTAKVVNAFCDRLSRSVDLEPLVRQRISAACLEIRAQFDAMPIPPPFSIDNIWEEYLDEKGFRISLWESQRAGLVAVYNYYESFLTRCMAIAVRQRRYALRKKFRDDFAREFGQAIANECWNDPDVQVLRLTRNAIVHEGGRDSQALRDLGCQYRVQDGVFHIYPEDLKAAIRLVERCALRLAAVAAKHPSFKQQKTRR